MGWKRSEILHGQRRAACPHASPSKARSMPRFFLHIQDRDDTIPDEGGCVYACFGDARQEALRIMAELVRDGSWQANSHRGRYVSVCDDRGEELETVALWEAIERLRTEEERKTR